MQEEKKIDVLFQILSSEQQILQRVDQKAFTMLSLMGVFAVFFIIHYTKIPPNTFNFICIFLYFLSVITSIYFLVLVVVPRVKDVETSPVPEKKKILPTFFGGIIKYKSAEEYSKQLNLLLEDPNETYETFAKSVYSIGRINAFKHKYLKYGIMCFVVAIAMEFTIIVSLYVNLLIVSFGG
jgi:hypothetical protein